MHFILILHLSFWKKSLMKSLFSFFMSYRAPHSFEGPIRDTLWYSKEDWPKVEQAQAAKNNTTRPASWKVIRKT